MTNYATNFATKYLKMLSLGEKATLCSPVPVLCTNRAD